MTATIVTSTSSTEPIAAVSHGPAQRRAPERRPERARGRHGRRSPANQRPPACSVQSTREAGLAGERVDGVGADVRPREPLAGHAGRLEPHAGGVGRRCRAGRARRAPAARGEQLAPRAPAARRARRRSRCCRPAAARSARCPVPGTWSNTEPSIASRAAPRAISDTASGERSMPSARPRSAATWRPGPQPMSSTGPSTRSSSSASASSIGAEPAVERERLDACRRRAARAPRSARRLGGEQLPVELRRRASDHAATALMPLPTRAARPRSGSPGAVGGDRARVLDRVDVAQRRQVGVRRPSAARRARWTAPVWSSLIGTPCEHRAGRRSRSPMPQ